ncbi:MAG: hypothetical protein IH591_06020 [Bacteroidales bacterium]|nr:hypothetical protein [Bacteroidales bacterium]
MRFILSILFLPLIFFYGSGFLSVVEQISFSNSIHLYFVISLGLSSLLFFFLIGRMSFIAIFEHELTHNIFAVLTFNKPAGFHVSRGEGGLFQYEGRGNFLITLSPYFFLTFSFFLLPLFLVIDQVYFKHFIIALGILTGYHTSTTIKETHLQQPDLRDNGFIFSFIVIILGNLLNYGVIFSFVSGGWNGIGRFLAGGVTDLYRLIINLPGLVG